MKYLIRRMAYYLSPPITPKLNEMWKEGAPYQNRNIYSIEEGKLPPVHYDEHIFKPHSLTHCEAPKHTQKNGKSIGHYFERSQYFWGKCQVLKLKENRFKKISDSQYHWEVSCQELQSRLKSVPEKLLLTVENYPINKGFHDSKYALTLSPEAAKWLTSHPQFHLYGTSYQSCDFKPGSKDRPVHQILFEKAVIFECLDLNQVPEGEYFFFGAPLRITEASESPVCPMLLTREEVESQL